ncbi:type I restriction endonuclease subunit R [Arthrobacter bambusae]|uniref:Type I restriction enzyme endonuclease subunit n=1 Tax=Arthrobacter bambusae TaxID=1338426 RepID=A0AAW8DFX9_9MICC|nr:HsdR family type I site-specific deoxyribonuclease [Arthrobacter bambusae]MDP9904806.1 type I restriction enzyme R subunit [Arthrobacter bambusae]MDQ0129622.1 type I restriction enzyme R subunit [Arthrobacter bambusae]MDQ0180765.1 type I restriction enzyme R subunit [Arthrobacter bambusae]
MGWTEASTIQRSLLEWAEEAGWEHIPGQEQPRDEHDVIVEDWAREALLGLNPDLVDDPESAELVLHELNQAVLDANNGLVAANERLTVMLRGDYSFRTIDGKHVPRRLIDFEVLDNNRFVVADEVTIAGAVKPRRFDVVYYVNGFPLVVAETKTPVKHSVSWVNAAKDIHDVYEEEYPNFFATNVFNVATEGLELRMAPIRAVPDPDSEIWAPWGSTEDDPRVVTGPARVERAARLLLRPETILPILKDLVMFRHARDASEIDVKFLPRYPQFEAALAIHDKVLADRPGGLIWHHQGSGKTELMAFAAARLLRDDAVIEKFGGAPTVIVIADRKDLVRQTAEMFETAGMPRLSVPEDRHDLHALLRSDDPCVIITTVHKFAEAGHLNDRSNIVVLVDEAHRSQEGKLGDAWRAAVPNAKFFGATGTAIEDKDRSTFKLFGDPEDPDFVMSRYTPEQSIADGFTKPVIVEGRSVGFSLEKEALDEAFDELADEEGLDEDEKVYLSGKASHIETILSNPERVAAVCGDIVDHYLTYVAPLGQKAQVVAYNQSLVIAYARAIQAELERRSAVMPDGRLREVGVVMHVADAKDTPKEYRKYMLTPDQEEALKRRFKKVDDPMSFIVVTAKWMTGFNAPIEGVLYLDKPAKEANLFQTITRPNRPWKNPVTGQRKDYGRVVDYIGLAKAIGIAIAGPQAKTDEGDDLNVVDASKLAGKFVTDLTRLLHLFASVDTTDASFESLAQAHERIPDGSVQRAEFVEAFVALQTVWEFLDPHPMLLPFKQQYLWLAKIYESIRPKDVSKAFLWARLGAKTTELIHGHMNDVAVKSMASRTVTLDAAGLALVKRIAEQLRLSTTGQTGEEQGDVYQQVLDSIEARLRRRVAESESPVYKSLAQRIEKLRAKAIENVEDSLAFLQAALKIAQDVVAADRAADEGDEETLERLADPQRGVLTQIVEENTPPGLHTIVPDIVDRIDAIVEEVAYTGWTSSDSGDKAVRRELRSALKNYGLPVKGDLFDRTYEYVRENY